MPLPSPPFRLRHGIVLALVVCIAALTALAVPAHAQDEARSGTFSEAEQAEIRALVRDYLLDNPEVIAEALTVLQARQMAEEEQTQREQLALLEDEVFRSVGSPTMGNPEGDVTLVEFFDYNCGYCKRVLDSVFQLAEEDSGLRVVFKELPILAPSSLTAARAALAAREQDRYVEYHNALMGHRGALSDDVIFRIAEDVGLDVDRLRQDMESEAVQEEIAANMALAERIGIRGTPAFIIGDQVIPGAVGLDTLRELVGQARAG